jgi:hypothetical protein
MTDIRLSLPDGLAAEAAREGLLQPARIEGLERDAMRAIHLARLADARAALAAQPLPVLTTAELWARIDAYRAARGPAEGG